MLKTMLVMDMMDGSPSRGDTPVAFDTEDKAATAKAVAAASNGLECLAKLFALEPDVLVIATDIPWGGGDGVIARLNDGLPVRRKPLILVMGEMPAETLSARTGVESWNCFSMPLRREDLLDRIGMELGIRLLRGAEDRQWPSQEM